MTGHTATIGVHLDASPGADAAVQDTASEDVSGVVVAATEVREPCSLFWIASTTCQTDAVRLDIAQGDGGTRALTIASVSADGWKKPVTATVGKTVTLAFRRARGFQWNVSVGFVLRDTAGVLMAGEFGPFVPTLRAGDLSEPAIRDGEAVCVEHVTCGDFEQTALVFHGDTEAAVAPGAEGEFSLNSRPYVAHTLGAGRWTSVTCTDLESTITWAIWRKDP